VDAECLSLGSLRRLGPAVAALDRREPGDAAPSFMLAAEVLERMWLGTGFVDPLHFRANPSSLPISWHSDP
jgi:hypothetical protein